MSNLADNLDIEFRSLITDPDHFGLLSSVAPGRYSFYTGIAVLTGLMAGVVTAWLLYRHLGEQVPDRSLRRRPAPPTPPRPPPASISPVQNSGFHSPGMRPDFQWGGPLAAPLPLDPEPAISGADPATARLPISAPGPPRRGSDDPPTKTPPARPRWNWEPYEAPHPPLPPLQPAPLSEDTPRASVGPDYRWGNTTVQTSPPESHPSARPAPGAGISSGYRGDVPSAPTLPPESRPDSKPAPRASVGPNYRWGAPTTDTTASEPEPIPKPIPKPGPRASVSPDHRWGTHEPGTPLPKTRKPKRPNYRWSS
jgi:hypothetical protein